MPLWARRLAGCETGATAVEFALLAAPFLVLVVAMIEMAVVFVVTATLDQAVQEASRRVQVGAVPVVGSDYRRALQTEICNQLSWLSDRCDRLTVTTTVRVQAEPGANPIVMVRAMFRWPVISPAMSDVMASGGDGTYALVSGTALRLERG